MDTPSEGDLGNRVIDPCSKKSMGSFRQEIAGPPVGRVVSKKYAWGCYKKIQSVVSHLLEQRRVKPKSKSFSLHFQIQSHARTMNLVFK